MSADQELASTGFSGGIVAALAALLVLGGLAATGWRSIAQRGAKMRD